MSHASADCCICVRGLPATCQEEDVDALFRNYGRAVCISMPAEPTSKACRGYAFVTMASIGEAQDCIAALHGAEFCGRSLSVEVSRSTRRQNHIERQLGRRFSGPGLLPCERSRGDGVGDSRNGRTSTCSSDCFLAEPLCEPASSAPTGASTEVPLVPEPQPAAEPPFEPGSEPLIEEDNEDHVPKCSNQCFGENGQHLSRIRWLEEANIQAVGRQTADALLLQFQRQGFNDPYAAGRECLRVALQLLGEPSVREAAASIPVDPASKGANSAASLGPIVLLNPEEFKNPSSFLRVYGDPLAAAARRGEQPERYQDGNWRCEQCANFNYPRRQRCHKCHRLRGVSGDITVLQYCYRVHGMLSKGKVVD